MKLNYYFRIFCASSCFLFSCAKQVTKAPQTEAALSSQQTVKPLDYVKKMMKDTVTYIVEFHDTLDRGHFVLALEKLIKSFPSKAPNDTTKALFVKTQSVLSASQYPDSIKVQPTMISSAQPQETPSGKSEKPVVHEGGAMTIYTPYCTLDPVLSTLVEALPFTAESLGKKGQDSIAPLCNIKAVSDKKITIALSPKVQSAGGKPYSAFDVVALWSNHVKQRPAEGRALFRYVIGIDQFIAGREAVVPGFQIIDEKTVTLQLSQPDPAAVQRLLTSRLFPASFKAGPYYIKNEKNGIVQLAPNVHSRLVKPFLNSCEIRLGKDSNPFLSFSLNRYDAMELYSIKDADYARRAFSDKAVLSVFSERRYFLSFGLQSVDLRSALCRLFDRRDILNNYVKAEGSPLSAVESAEENIDAAALASPVLTSVPNTLAAAPIAVLFRSDDPISATIADKLLADISHAGLNCTVKGAAVEEYEKALIKRDYGIAVGCVSGSIVRDPSDRLRMATLWFSDETNERARIEQKQEFPLFSIKTYLLYKNKIGFLNDAIEGVYVKE